MDAVSCYFHEHELANVDLLEYNFADFNELPENPVVERFIPIKGSMIPILKIDRIIGTVLDRDKAKKMVTLLTPSGVVTVKIFGPVFAEYDKQISQKGADGKKHVVEKSLFTRGNKIIVTGIRREDSFIGKKYSKTPFHLIEQIVQVDDNGDILIKRERAEAA
jgi:DNA polymerase-3 subunit alpha